MVFSDKKLARICLALRERISLIRFYNGTGSFHLYIYNISYIKYIIDINKRYHTNIFYIIIKCFTQAPRLSCINIVIIVVNKIDNKIELVSFTLLVIYYIVQIGVLSIVPIGVLGVIGVLAYGGNWPIRVLALYILLLLYILILYGSGIHRELLYSIVI